MKRIDGLFDKISDFENILSADKKARANKKSYGIELFDKDRESNLIQLRNELVNGTYKTGEYHIFKIHEPKEREIARLDYKHRILHHAVMNILEPIWLSVFSACSYSCIPGRGIHKCLYDIRESMKDREGTKYCLKIDIQKFYPSIDRDILKTIVRKKIKDIRLINLLDEVIDSAPGTTGVPIGNYLSQYFANLYLTYFDHWLKEKIHVKYYFRYCDDIVILHESKEVLHRYLGEINRYVESELKLKVKRNYQVFPVEARGIDFLGYRIFHTHTLLRKSIKKNMIRKRGNQQSMASYAGWAIHCNSVHLYETLFKTKIYDTIKRKA